MSVLLVTAVCNRALACPDSPTIPITVLQSEGPDWHAITIWDTCEFGEMGPSTAGQQDSHTHTRTHDPSPLRLVPHRDVFAERGQHL